MQGNGYIIQREHPSTFCFGSCHYIGRAVHVTLNSSSMSVSSPFLLETKCNLNCHLSLCLATATSPISTRSPVLISTMLMNGFFSSFLLDTALTLSRQYVALLERSYIPLARAQFCCTVPSTAFQSISSPSPSLGVLLATTSRSSGAIVALIQSTLTSSYSSLYCARVKSYFLCQNDR